MAVVAGVALRGNPEARFEELYSACQPRVYRTCLAILRNHDDAAEATQEVFSRALPLVTELREPHLWLQTVARNYCLDQLRRQRVRGGSTLDEDTPSGLRDDPERETLLRDALRQAFAALTPRERRALGRVLLMDDSLAEIAGMLGISYGAAAQVVSRARRRAAMAARAVIGASLAWLARLALPRDRSRTTRVAAQLLGSSQNLVLAAAVLFTAGTLTEHAAAATTSHTMRAASGQAVIAGTAQSAAVAASGSGAGGAGASPGGGAVWRSLLPAGYPAVPIGSTVDQGRGKQPQPRNDAPPVVLHVTPPVGTSCASASVQLNRLNGSNITSRSAQVCKP